MRFSLSSSSPMRTGIVYIWRSRAGGNSYGSALTFFVKLINVTEPHSPPAIARVRAKTDLGISPQRPVNGKTAPHATDRRGPAAGGVPVQAAANPDLLVRMRLHPERGIPPHPRRGRRPRQIGVPRDDQVLPRVNRNSSPNNAIQPH